jgi:tetratricopeptide (TPR) repeat protein
VDVIRQSIASCRRLDDLLGSPAALPAALAQRGLVMQLLQTVRGEKVRQQLWTAASELSQLMGWLAFDRADSSAARLYFHEGLRAAHEAGAEALGAYILGYLSILETYGGEPHEGLAFAQAAATRADRTNSAVTRSWLATVEAEAWATLGSSRATELLLERAATELHNAKAEDEPGWIYHHDRSGVTSATATCYLLLGLPEPARAAIEETITLSQSKEVREQSLYLTRLAETYIPDSEIEEACKLAHQAILLAEETGSERALRRVRQLRTKLRPWSDSPYVRELDEDLAGAAEPMQQRLIP